MILSIIVPAYNTAKWLRNCVESLMFQDIDDYEVILLNDGSTDGTWQLMENLRAEYAPKLRIVNKPNEGVRATRNQGIDMAYGKWIMFVDSDDEVVQYSLGRIIHQAETVEGCDWVFLGVATINGIAKTDMDYSKMDSNCASPALLAAKTLDSTFSGPWSKLYRRDILIKNKIRFDPRIKMYEDAIFNMQYLKAVKKIVPISGIFYHYIVHPGSCSRKYHGEHIVDVVEHLRRERMKYFVTEHGMIEMTDRINRDAAFVYLYAIYSIYRANSIKKKYRKMKRYWEAASQSDALWSFQLDSNVPKAFAMIARHSLYVSHLFLLSVFGLEKIRRTFFKWTYLIIGKRSPIA